MIDDATIKRMAWESGLTREQAHYNESTIRFARTIEQLARQEQREEDARICETSEIPFDIDIWHGSTKKEITARTAIALAEAIRAAAEIGKAM